jgi:hypothetical protein
MEKIIIDMKVFILLILSFFLLQVSCVDDALFDGSVTVTDTIDLPDFSIIKVNNTFEVELVSDTVNKVLVSCGENLQKSVKIKVVDGTLYLDHDIKNNWSRKYQKVKLILHSKPFAELVVYKPVRIFNRDEYKGSSFFFVDFEKYTELDVNLDVDFCGVYMSSDNFGQYKVKGKANSAEIWGWGSCMVRADSLLVGDCHVLHRGMGDVYVNALNSLNVSIQFTGNVFYTGNPATISIENSQGSGKLLKK